MVNTVAVYDPTIHTHIHIHTLSLVYHVEAGEKIVMCMCKIRGGGGRWRAQWVNAGDSVVLLKYEENC